MPFVGYPFLSEAEAKVRKPVGIGNRIYRWIRRFAVRRARPVVGVIWAFLIAS